MKFHGSLVGSEPGPGKDREAQLDGGSAEGVERVVGFQAEVFVGVERASDREQGLCEIGVNTPVPDLVRVGQRIAGDAAAEAQAIELGAWRAQADLDIPHARVGGAWRERQAKERVEAGAGMDVAITLVALDALAKKVQRQVVHQLRADKSPRMSGAAPRTHSMASCRPSAVASCNR